MIKKIATAAGKLGAMLRSRYQGRPLGGRILTGFLVVACLSGLSGILCAGSIWDVSRRAESMYTSNLVPICDLTEVVKGYQSTLYLLRDVVMDKSPQEQTEHLDRLKQTEARVVRGLGQFFAANRTPEALALKQAIDEDLKLYDYFLDKIVELAGSDRRDEAVNIMRTQALDVTDRLDLSIAKLVALNKAQAQRRYTANGQAARSALLVSALCLGLGVIAALGIGWFLSRSLTRPLRGIASNVAAIARGDLTARIGVNAPAGSRNELDILSRDVDLMADTLHAMVGRLAQEARQLFGASSSLTGTSEEMARTVDLVSGEIHAVSGSSAEMHQTAGEIARNCTTAADNVAQANRAVKQGRQVMGETIESMRAIGEHARKTSLVIAQLGQCSVQIGDITDTIDDIADQTNLLALNAAIEAARAGEHGRGFAVVADEVRALAARTTGATKEISGMIRSIQAETRRAIDAMGQGVAEAELGVQKAVLTGEALESIMTTIQSIALEVSHIATAAEEQSATIGGISDSIRQVTGNINTSAAGTQQFATAAGELHLQAEELNRIVGGFSLEPGASCLAG